jgi:hypothetical protein
VALSQATIAGRALYLFQMFKDELMETSKEEVSTILKD